MDRWGQVVELITAEAQREGECPAAVEEGLLCSELDPEHEGGALRL